MAEVLGKPRKCKERQPPVSRRIGVLDSGEIVYGNLDSPSVHIPEIGLHRREDILPQALKKIHATGRGIRESLVETVCLEREIGVNNCAKTNDKSCIVWLHRPGQKHPSRFVLGVEAEPTDKVTIVLKREMDAPRRMRLIAAHLGEGVNPEPYGNNNSWENRQFWDTHAFVLYDLSQIDFAQLDKIYLDDGDKKKKITFKMLQDLFEQKERELLVSQTIAYLATSAFKKNFIELETATQKEHLERIEREGLAREARRQAQARIVKEHGLAPQPVDQEKLPRKVKRERDLIGRTPIRYRDEATGEEQVTTLINWLTGRNLKSEEVIERHKLEKRLARAALSAAQQAAEREIRKLIQELYNRMNEPEIVAASSSWTNTPDAGGYLGPRGVGFSGAFAHFFLYLAHAQKRKRFPLLPEERTVEGLIALTSRLKIELDLAEMVVEDPDIPTNNAVVVLEDKHERRRYYVRQPGGELIIAYQKKGQEVKISTVIPGCSDRYLENIVGAAKIGEKKPRINKLGPEIKTKFSNVSGIEVD